MQHPDTEIYDIVKPLLQGSNSEQEAVVKKVFTEDAVFTHPFIIARGRSAILQTYHFWKLANRKITVDIERAVLSKDGKLLILVNFNSHEYLWFWPFSFPFMKLHYDIKLEVVDTPEGKKFSTQDDHLRITDTINDLPGIKWIVRTAYLRELWGWLLTTFMGFILALASTAHQQHQKLA